MNCMLIAELAMLSQLHAVRVITLVLVRRVVPLLALGTRQSYDYPHCCTPPVTTIIPETSVYLKSSGETIFDGYLQHFITIRD